MTASRRKVWILHKHEEVTNTDEGFWLQRLMNMGCMGTYFPMKRKVWYNSMVLYSWTTSHFEAFKPRTAMWVWCEKVRSNSLNVVIYSTIFWWITVVWSANKKMKNKLCARFTQKRRKELLISATRFHWGHFYIALYLKAINGYICIFLKTSAYSIPHSCREIRVHLGSI